MPIVSLPKIKHVRAFTVRGGGADYHDQGEGHWIDDHIATPMSRYPDYRQSRQSFGINVLGTLVVEIEAENGVTGVAVTTGGEPAAWIVEKFRTWSDCGGDLLSAFTKDALLTNLMLYWAPRSTASAAANFAGCFS